MKGVGRSWDERAVSIGKVTEIVGRGGSEGDVRVG